MEHHRSGAQDCARRLAIEAHSSEISNDVWLVRGIASQYIEGEQISSAAFNTKEISVAVLSLDSVRRLLENRDRFRVLAAVKVDYCRKLGLQVLPDPTEYDPDHVLILLRDLGTGQRKKMGKKLKDAAVTATVEGPAEEVYGRLRACCDEFDRIESVGA